MEKPRTVAEWKAAQEEWNRCLIRVLGPWQKIAGDDCRCGRYPNGSHPGKGTVVSERRYVLFECGRTNPIVAHSEEEKTIEDARARKNGWILCDE
jgi:hypothetical protein